MRFDLSDDSQGEWFRFFRSEVRETGEIVYLEPEADAGRVCIRVTDPDTMERIQSQTRKRSSEFVLNPKTRQMERVSFFEQTPEQEKKEREMLWDYVIQDWEGMLDKNESEIPCTIEFKLRLMNVPVFARFVTRCLQIITSTNQGAEEAETKN